MKRKPPFYFGLGIALLGGCVAYGLRYGEMRLFDRFEMLPVNGEGRKADRKKPETRIMGHYYTKRFSGDFYHDWLVGLGPI